MNEEQIIEARELRRTGWQRKALASRYGVSYATMGRMLLLGDAAQEQDSRLHVPADMRGAGADQDGCSKEFDVVVGVLPLGGDA